MPRIIGIDPSLTALGMGVIDTHPAGGIHAYQLGVLKSKKLGDQWTDAARRIAMIVGKVEPILASGTVDLVVMESPAFSSTSGASHDRSWLWGRIYDAATELGVAVLTATPQQLKMYATGKGNADKDVVVAACVRRWPNIEGLDNNNAADAWTLATMGARKLGVPVEPKDLGVTYTRALEKMRA